MTESRQALEQVIGSLPYRTWASLPGNRTDASKVSSELGGTRRPLPGSAFARGLVRLAREHPSGSLPPATSGLSPVWQADAVWTTALSSFNGVSRAKAHAEQWRVVYVQLLHSVNAAANEAEIPVFLQEGWTIVGWGTYGQGTDPYQDGLAAAAISRRVTSLRGWKANGELWAEGADAGKTGEFLRGWKDGKATIPLGWSVLSSTTASYARAFDYQTALSVPGADVDPQVYGATQPNYTVNACLGMLNKAKVPLSRTTMSFDVNSTGKGPFDDYLTWKGPRRCWIGEWGTVDTWTALAR